MSLKHAAVYARIDLIVVIQVVIDLMSADTAVTSELFVMASAVRVRGSLLTEWLRRLLLWTMMMVLSLRLSTIKLLMLWLLTLLMAANETSCSRTTTAGGLRLLLRLLLMLLLRRLCMIG